MMFMSLLTQSVNTTVAKEKAKKPAQVFLPLPDGRSTSVCVCVCDVVPLVCFVHV